MPFGKAPGAVGLAAAVGSGGIPFGSGFAVAYVLIQCVIISANVPSNLVVVSSTCYNIIIIKLSVG